MRAQAGASSLLRLTPVVAAHLAEALRQYRSSCRLMGMGVPAELEQLQSECAKAAMGGLERTDIDRLADLHDAAAVPIRLLTYAQVARSLGCHERTVRRLVTRGELIGVRVGGSVRVRDVDLDAYIDNLAEEAS